MDVNWRLFLDQRNNVIKLRRMSVRHYFEDRCNSDVNGHAFWKTVKPFMSNKGPKGENIMLREDSHIATEDNEIADIFNTYFSTIADFRKTPFLGS